MNKYKQIVEIEKEASNKILELKNEIYKYLTDVSGCGNLKSVEIISNRKACNPVITIKYDSYSFLYMSGKMVFSPRYTDEIPYPMFYEVVNDIEYVIQHIIRGKEVK